MSLSFESEFCENLTKVNVRREEERLTNGVANSRGRPPRSNGRSSGSREFAKRKTRPKSDSRPPRFKKLEGGRTRAEEEGEGKPRKADDSQKADAVVPSPARVSSPFPGSSDQNGEEWETASDASHDYVVARQEVNEPEVATHVVRPASQRGRGRGRGRGGAREGDAQQQQQVYSLHSVDFTNPDAIGEALRDAAKSANHDKADKKAKHNQVLLL